MAVTDRRGVGLLVILLGLLAAVVVPNAVGGTVRGVAMPVPLPGPPAENDCVGPEFDLGWDVIGVDPSEYRYPELTVGDCGRPHSGEVVSVIARPTRAQVTVEPGSGFSIDDQNMVACSQSAGRFVGQADSAGETAFRFDYWWSTIFTRVVPMTPSVRQQAAGQHWLTCVTYVVSQSEVTGPALVRYEGTLRDAVSTGFGRDYLGYCPTETDWNQMTSISCSEPHHGEVFGQGGLSHDVPRATLTASCAKLIAAVTHNPNVVRDGRLIVSVQVTDMNDETVTGARIIRGSNLQCGVVATGGRMLKGSMIAIGTGPIPWV